MKFVEGHEGVRRHEGATRRQEAMDAFRRAGRGRHEAVHLPVGRRQQRRVHRDAGAGGRSGHPLLGRALRPRDLEGRHPDLRASRARTRSAQWLETEGVKNIANVNDHLKPAHPWFEFYGAKSADELAGAALHQARTWHKAAFSSLLMRRASVFLQDLDATDFSQAGIARVRHADRVRAELGGAGQRDRAGRGPPVRRVARRAPGNRRTAQ